MRLNFALSLSFDGIVLLRRMPGGWAPIGEVSLESSDLDGDMARLRKTARSIHRGAHQVGLIIPNEQMRYLDLPDLGGDQSARDAAIKAALEKETPYTFEQLAYDVSTANGRLMVAAVARETLDEAEAFAKSHNFVPVAHLAIAPELSFEGPVFFGKAAQFKGKSEPERPLAALRVIAATEDAFAPTKNAFVPEDQNNKPNFLSSRSENKADVVEPAKAEPDAKPEPEMAEPAAKPDVVEAPQEKPARFATPTPAPKPQPDPKPQEPAAPTARFGGAQAEVPVAKDAVKAPVAPAPSAPTVAPPAAAAVPAAAPVLRSPEPPVVSNAPPIEAIPAKVTDDIPEAEASPSFSSIRATRDADAEAPASVPKLGAAAAAAASSMRRFMPSLKADTGVKGAKITDGRIEAEEVAEDTAEDTGKGATFGFFSKRRKAEKPVDPVPEAEPAAMQNDDGIIDDVPPMPAGVLTAQTLARKAPEATTASKAALQRLAAIRTAAGDRDARRNEASLVGTAGAGAAAATLTASQSERERMTVFGQRSKDQVGGKPRFLGLMLTSALLLLLIGVAAWASVFMDEGLARFFRNSDQSPAVALAPAALPEVNPEQLDVRPAEEELDDASVQVAALDTGVAEPVEPVQAPLSIPRQPSALSAEEAAATYAATGIWQRAPTAPAELPVGNVEDIYVASIDPAVQQFDAVALPDARQIAPGATLEDPGLPPPAGMVFDIDERGLVRATAQGALTPEGLRIFAGRPPVTPPLRTALAAPQAPDAADVPPSAEALALAAFRPNARPSDLVEQRERAELGGISRAELGKIRPNMRPKTAQEEAEIEAPDAPATRQAVARSLAPVSRPRNINAIVRRAEREATRAPVQTASAAAVAPRTVRPDVPSSASVARSATVRNAINLNKINLIGVYGTSSNRRALVRLANGRYKKVKIGDRIDGGRVSAISESELRYNKSGRSVVLKMPRS